MNPTAAIESVSALNSAQFKPKIQSQELNIASSADSLRFKEASKPSSIDFTTAQTDSIQKVTSLQTGLNELIERLSKPSEIVRPSPDAPADQHYAYLDKLMQESKKSSIDTAMMQMSISMGADTSKKTTEATNKLLSV